jgi:hypothetical protein
MAETRYQGSCHCGRVAFDVDLDLTQPVLACNCSMCGRMGWRLAFVPPAKFHLRRGGDAVTDYQFGKKQIHHLFCATCGIRAFGHGNGPGGGEMFAVNVRCLDGIDVDALPLHHFDGKRL